MEVSFVLSCILILYKRTLHCGEFFVLSFLWRLYVMSRMRRKYGLNGEIVEVENDPEPL